MQLTQSTLPVGAVVQGRYIVAGLLGQGGFGAVYLVRDRRVKHNLFALKELIDSNKQERDRFTRECELLRRLDYPALPRIYRVFEDSKRGRAYMLMDYIEGPNLEMLRQKQPEKRFLLSQILTIMEPIIGAINYLHSQQPSIIHRDIKPSNIVVPTAGDEAVLVDFGIAKEYTSDTTTTAIRRVSPCYAAPELYGVGTDLRTDIYELGATFYALLTGVVPVDSFIRMTQIASKGTDPLEPVCQVAPTIPEPVAEAISRAMSIRIDDRFSTVEEFWQSLNADPKWREMPPASIPPVDPPPQPVIEHQTKPLQEQGRSAARPSKRGILVFALLLLVIGLSIGAALWSYSTTGAAVQFATPTPVVTPTSIIPTVGPTVTPTTPVPVVPGIAGSYKGDIHNTPADVNSTMSLSNIKQIGRNISGRLTLGPGLIGDGLFTGTVDAARHIQFTVPGVSGNASLHFYGTVQSDGRLKGNYCSLDRTGHCNQLAGGYGTWNVTPAPQQSLLNSTLARTYPYMLYCTFSGTPSLRRREHIPIVL
jgi:serine/threonine protein kinase